MLILTSPSKSMETEVAFPDRKYTQPLFIDKVEEIHRVLKDKSMVGLQELLGVSEKLAELNYERYQEWEAKHTLSNSRPALYTYSGDVYQGLTVQDYSDEELDYAQESVRIISGFYGILRPLDLMQPYRLEMNTDISIGQSRDLYAYWQEALTAYLQEEIEKENHAVVLNLASNQYSDVVNFDDLSVPVVDVEFKEDRDGESKTIAIYLKKARGMMIHYCIQHMATTIDQVFGFKEAGYQLQEQSDTNLVFVRD